MPASLVKSTAFPRAAFAERANTGALPAELPSHAPGGATGNSASWHRLGISGGTLPALHRLPARHPCPAEPAGGAAAGFSPHWRGRVGCLLPPHTQERHPVGNRGAPAVRSEAGGPAAPLPAGTRAQQAPPRVQHAVRPARAKEAAHLFQGCAAPCSTAGAAAGGAVLHWAALHWAALQGQPPAAQSRAPAGAPPGLRSPPPPGPPPPGRCLAPPSQGPPHPTCMRSGSPPTAGPGRGGARRRAAARAVGMWCGVGADRGPLKPVGGLQSGVGCSGGGGRSAQGRPAEGSAGAGPWFSLEPLLSRLPPQTPLPNSRPLNQRGLRWGGGLAAGPPSPSRGAAPCAALLPLQALGGGGLPPQASGAPPRLAALRVGKPACRPGGGVQALRSRRRRRGRGAALQRARRRQQGSKLGCARVPAAAGAAGRC